MRLKGLRLGYALTGSFCTFSKVMVELEKIIEEGAEVFPIVSESVKSFDTRFGKASDLMTKLEIMTGKPVISTIVEAEPIGPKSMLDILVVSPCTGNTLSKIANAVTDTSVTMAVKAHLRNNKPVVLGISTNDGLGANAKNLGILLNRKNMYFIPFEQDDPDKKCNSLVARFELTIPTIEEALKGRQIQPVLV
ncbi:MAG TPA: dipicolinate synthase subunit B [Clostridiaceae bacterium]|nr:dipicolinate synthase subunit B [Clostridiaceae bacterium]